MLLIEPAKLKTPEILLNGFDARGLSQKNINKTNLHVSGRDMQHHMTSSLTSEYEVIMTGQCKKQNIFFLIFFISLSHFKDIYILL